MKPKPTNDEKLIRIGNLIGIEQIHREPTGLWGWTKIKPKFVGATQGEYFYVRVPDFHESLTAIQAAVAAQSDDFGKRFCELLVKLANERACYFCHLTATDWCDCFLAVLDAMGKDGAE